MELGVDVAAFLVTYIGALGTTTTLIMAPLPGVLIVPFPIAF
jgi:hypothetical protein